MVNKASCKLQLAVQQNFKHFCFFVGGGGGGKLDPTQVLLMPSIMLCSNNFVLVLMKFKSSCLGDN